MTALTRLLNQFRTSAQSEREKGTYFEELIIAYLRHEASYADLYETVLPYAEWARENGLDARDTGIDLVAKTNGTDELHAIQCKFYAEDYRVKKSDIDSFFTASGQKPFTHRIIVSTTSHWTENAELALVGQQPAVTKIDLKDLENSQIDWSKYQPSKPPVLKKKKTLRKHQVSAHKSVLTGLKSADRGKLIMACGTGKTFTSLKIAEDLAGANKRVLFLVPSLSLLSQTLTEWTQESDIPLHSFAVCSDDEVGKKRKRDEDTVETFAHELRYPATTDAKRLATEMAKRHDAHHMSVVFSTYHSIDVISRAQHLHGLDAFDLIVCDEAHRTTGATFENESESNFVKVHDAEFIRSAKRLYMTATPRIYAPMAKATAERDSVTLCSMDDPALFGEQLHVITFSEAVQLDLLCDYKVIVLTIDEAHVSSRLQGLLADDDNQLKVDDAARIIGCWKALSKQDIRGEIEDADSPMRRAVAFCQVIEPQRGARTHKVSSKQIAGMFQAVVEAYNEKETQFDDPLICEADHVDGSMNAAEKESKLDWLKAPSAENTCRILSNVRCLSEGVDVPSLDAVLFLTPRSSQVDVVQSVGRVMRKDPEGKKKRGYVILPVVIPAGMDPAEALNDNKVYKVVWEVLQALRSHDDKFDAMINKLELIGSDPKKMEVVAITDKIQQKSQALTAKQQKQASAAGYNIGEANDPAVGEAKQAELQFNVGELERALYARIVKKCGNRNYWDEWAKDIAKIANTHISRITAIVQNPENETEVAAFQNFATELRDDLNDSITDAEVIEMLAQHLITKPVFDALFEDYSFASYNPVSLAMQQVLDVLQEHRLDKEADTLEKFYDSVKMRADGIDNAAGKQKIVVELYDKFFRNAFPRMTERLGIVYTPVEVVDFIIHSINDLLQQEFNLSLGDKGVHIIDPFTGTGTFITRLLQSGLISKEQLPHKYKNEIHANEIVLLAYYIAAINIEAVYHSIMGDGAWGMGHRVSALKTHTKGNDAVIQRFDRMAGSHESGRVGLSGDEDLPQRGTVRPDQSDTPISSVDSGEHSGGLRPGEPQGVSSISSHSTRESHGTGDASANRHEGELSRTRDDEQAPTPTNLCGQAPYRSAQISDVGDRVLGMGDGNNTPNPTPQTPNPIPYTPFPGICLTDTFQLYEKDDLISSILVDNSGRRKRQKALDIRVIMGNPPYSAGQESANDNNANIGYPDLDQNIRDTYARHSSATNKNALYDSYIRAIRWASDRLGTSGIVGFVTNAGFLEANPAAGIRKCLAEEFSSIYVFHLRGNARTSGEVRRKEKDNVFGQGTRTPIAITLLVKNPAAKTHGQIYWHDIGDYLTREQKLEIVSRFKSINGISQAKGWTQVQPDAHHDWVNQRDNSFKKLITLGDKSQKEISIFSTYSRGVETARDAWIYNYSKTDLLENCEKSINFYNSELSIFKTEFPEKVTSINEHLPINTKKISWTSSLISRFEKKKHLDFDPDLAVASMYRPFSRCWLFLYEDYIHRMGQNEKFYPKGKIENLTLCINGAGNSGKPFSVLITEMIVDLNIQHSGGQCFPLNLYEKAGEGSHDSDDLFAQADPRPHPPSPEPHTGYTRKDGISDAGLAHFQAAYPGETISKEDLFYYIYGLLHSPEYRTRYADNLSKELPRIPAVKKASDFLAYSKAGRDLAHWHLNYETVEMYMGCRVLGIGYGKLGDGVLGMGDGNKTPHPTPQTPHPNLKPEDYRVTKMKFAKVKDPETGKSVADKTTVIYNPKITVKDIPLEAYDYIVNGKPAIEWVMERQAVTIDKKSGIKNDANLWATETMGNAKYPLELLLRVITVSLETNKIVKGLPELEIDA